MGERILRKLQWPVPRRTAQWRSVLQLARSSDPDRRMEETLQHEETTQRIGLSPTDTGSHHPDRTQADHALTINLDQSDRAAQPLSHRSSYARMSLSCQRVVPGESFIGFGKCGRLSTQRQIVVRSTPYLFASSLSDRNGCCLSVGLEAGLRGRVLVLSGVSSHALGSNSHGSCGSSFVFAYSKRLVGFGAVLFGIMRSSPFLLGLLDAPHAPSIYEKRPEVSCN